ncbi:MAG TPA: SGNH/GDSL hydrolase family protein [Actinomycetota bacterium]|nr:SGNH/GDSL hydrolase family protein [Actinomycetota bacterium]
MAGGKRAAAILTALLVIPALSGIGNAASIPSSMSALGDSITRAFNAGGWYVDYPSRSWSTGTDTGVNSHYLRIRAKNSAINNKNYNDARSGAEMIDLNGQAQTAVSRGVQYVTILMGANDVCASSEAGMTSVTDFRNQFQTAMTTLTSGLPNASIFVGSVPRIKRLWQVGKDSSSARAAWDGYNICQSMLANPLSTAQADVDRRNRVDQRNIDFNTQLQQVCAQYANCKFDDNAIFQYKFLLSHMSTWDYFHPNKSGQAVLASVSYAAGFNW